LVQILKFLPTLVYLTPRGGEPRQNFLKILGVEKLEWCGYQTVQMFWDRFRHNTGVWQTDRHRTTVKTVLCITSRR